MLFLPALMFTTLVDDLNDNDVTVFFKVLLYTTSMTSHSTCSHRVDHRYSLRVYPEK